jgi:uncharacterized protein (TIGR00369 family)
MSNEHDAGIRTGNPFHDLLGVEIVERGGGRARIRLPMREQLKGGVGGGLHGGVLSSLVDIVAILAISTTVGPSERMAGTAELNLSYLRPAIGAEVFATAHVLKKGRMIVVVDVDITDRDDRLLAKGRLSYAIRQV